MGRQPIGEPWILPMHLRKQRHALADEALGDAIDDSRALRDLVAINQSGELVPDATTLT